jgi:hypothetical protein
VVRDRPAREGIARVGAAPPEVEAVLPGAPGVGYSFASPGTCSQPFSRMHRMKMFPRASACMRLWPTPRSGSCACFMQSERAADSSSLPAPALLHRGCGGVSVAQPTRNRTAAEMTVNLPITVSPKSRGGRFPPQDAADSVILSAMRSYSSFGGIALHLCHSAASTRLGA